MAIIDRRGATVSATDAPSSSTPNPDLAIKTAVRLASTGSNVNIQAFGLGVLDGIQLAAGDRVLLKDQADATQNGVYNASSGVWAMSSDFQNNSQVASGCQAFVTQGVLNGQSGFYLATSNPIVLGTTALTFLSLRGSIGTLARAILPNVNAGHVLPYLDTDVNWSSNSWSWVTDGTGFSGVLQAAGGTTITGTPTINETPGVHFAFGSQSFTIVYTVKGSDTNNTIAAGLVAAINADPRIEPNGIFAYYLGGNTINIQWNYATAPTVTAVNSAHTTITLGGPNAAMDAVVLQLGRAWPGRTTLAGDTLTGIDWTGPNSSSSGALATHWAQIVPYISNPAAGATGQGGLRFATGSTSAATGNNAITRMVLLDGLVFYDENGALATGGSNGPGTINLPNTGNDGYYLGGNAVIKATGIFAPGANVFGGIAAGSVLNLQSTASGAPSGDFVQIKAGNHVGYTFDGATSTLGVAGSVVGRLAFANATSGTITLAPPTGALGSAVLTLPDITDTLAGLTAPTFVTSITAPLVLGGAAAGSVLTLRSTSNGSPSADRISMIVTGGESLRIGNAAVMIGAVSGNPAGQLHVRVTTDENMIWGGPLALGDGVSINSLNDAVSTERSLEIKASTLYLNGTTALRLSSNVANGVVATAMSSLGPSGSHTTIQEWFAVQNAAGTTRYIPAF